MDLCASVSVAEKGKDVFLLYRRVEHLRHVGDEVRGGGERCASGGNTGIESFVLENRFRLHVFNKRIEHVFTTGFCGGFAGVVGEENDREGHVCSGVFEGEDRANAVIVEIDSGGFPIARGRHFDATGHRGSNEIDLLMLLRGEGKREEIETGGESSHEGAHQPNGWRLKSL